MPTSRRALRADHGGGLRVPRGARIPEEETPSLNAVPFLGALVKMEEDAAALSRHANRPADVRTAGHRFFR